MNAINDNNDPFEDIFRNRFADFESEPDMKLWQKIEPKLPVDSTRKFPYWQTSAVVILLLLAGLWTYHHKYSDNFITKSDDSRTKNAITNLPSSVFTQNTKLNNPLIINDLSSNTTNNATIKSQGNTIIKSSSLQRLSISAQATMPENRVQISSLFSRQNTTIELSSVPLEKELPMRIRTSAAETFLMVKTKNNLLENNTNPLNLFYENNSNEKQEIIVEKPINNSSVSNVFAHKENVSVLSKNFLTSLDSKSYSLLKNYFKTPRIKFVVVPKKDDYFKERRPLEIYVSVMPLLNYYTITPNGNDANFVHSIAVNNDADRLGFYTQAGLVFTLSDRFKLRTGLTFTRTNHSINYQIRTDSLIVQPSDKQGVDVSFEEKKANYSQVANYLGTKIELQYIFLEGEALSHYLNVGLEGSYRLNGVKQFNGFANFAYGVTRQIGDNAYLFVEPTFSYSLNQHSENNSFLLVKPNKIGFNIGVNFKIK
jgi:hypothetical protein